MLYLFTDNSNFMPSFEGKNAVAKKGLNVTMNTL